MKGVHSLCDFHRVKKHLLSNKGVVFAVKKRPFFCSQSERHSFSLNG